MVGRTFDGVSYWSESSRVHQIMKMYILIRESVPVGNAMVAAAHASLACYLRFRDHPDIHKWLTRRAVLQSRL